MKKLSLLDSRILIVDDQEPNVLLLKGILEDYGYTNLRTLTDSRQVISQVETFQPDLILLDLMMPYFDGYQVLETLGATLPADSYLPILVLTADIRAEAKQRALSLGAKDFLTKPFDHIEVILRIQNLLETRHLYAQLQNQNLILEQKVAERTAELAKQSRLLELFFKHTLSSLAILDRDFNFLRVNEAYARSDERQVSDFPGHNHFEFYPSDVQAIFEQVVRTREPYQTFARPFVYAEHPERGTTYWDWTLTPVLDADGEVELLIMSLNNVTERRQAEMALRASDERFSRLVAQLNEVVWSASLDGSHILDMNQAFESVYGIPVDEYRANPHLWIEMTHPEDRKIAEASSKELFKSGQSAVEYRIVRPDGEIRWILDRKSLLFDEQGNPVQMGGIVHDITERKQAEVALERRARELQILYETSLEINAQTNLDSMLSTIVERAALLVHVESGALFLTNPDGQSLKLTVGFNLQKEFIGTALKLGEGLAGTVAQTGQSMFVKDYQNWEARPDVYKEAPMHRVLAVPLKVKDKIIGVINVIDLKHTGSFSDEEIWLVSLFADQTALAIESARLYEQERTRRAELATLYESAMTISSNLSLNVVLKTVAKQAAMAINTKGCALSFWDAERDVVVTMEDYRTASLDGAEHPGTTYILEDYPATRHVFKTRQPLIVSHNNPQSDPAELILMNKKGMSSLMILPLVARDQVIGLMELYEIENEGRVFTEDEIRLAQSLSVQTAIFIDNARLFEQAERRLRRTEALHTIDVAIAGSMDVNLVFNVIFDQAFSQLGLDAAVVLLYNQGTQVLEYAAGRGFRTEALQHTRLPMGEGYAGRVALGRQMVHIPDIQTRKTDFLRSPTFHQEDFVSYFGVPLIAKGEIKGVLEVFHRTSFEADTEWLSFLDTLAGQAAIAIDNANLFKGLQLSNIELIMAYDATIEGWSRAMDLRDKETQDHTLRVTTMTEQLAREMGISGDELIHVRRGSLLHDIGKMGVPDSILLNPGRLTDEEWVVMRQHPQFAHDMIEPIAYLRPAMDIPYCHHEKWDGSGYPRGLKGEEIPLAARIFAVVDVYDALTSDRPYRSAWSKEKTVGYIKNLSGVQFDPKVADVFLNMIKKEA